MDDALLEAVIDFLSGRRDDDLLLALALIRQDARELHFARFWSALAEDQGGVVASRVRARLAALDDGHRQRIEDAPEAWTLISAAVPGATLAERADRLERWCEVEEALSRGEETVPSAPGGWTALGDWYLPGPGAAAGGGASRSPGSEPISPPPVYRAPVLDIGVPVDWRSPAARGPLPEIAGGAERFDDRDSAVAMEHLAVADQVLDQPTLGAWRELVRCHTAVIVLRNDPTTTGFISGTTRLALRRPVFRNAHADDADPARVLDGWIHECVHAVLDTVELVRPLVAPDVSDGRRRITVPSPWTGRVLDLDTYVHATLVWFALWHLWIDVLRADALPDSVALPMLTRASRGFVSAEPPLSQLRGVASSALAEGVAEALSRAHNRVAAVIGGVSLLPEPPLSAGAC